MFLGCIAFNVGGGDRVPFLTARFLIFDWLAIELDGS
jgi:hypothetical protein